MAWLFSLNSQILIRTKVLSIHTVIWLMMLTLTGCQTTSKRSVVLENLNKSYSLLRRVVELHLPGGQRAISTNGREFTSQYFPSNGDMNDDGTQAPDRSYALILILGDRRPYRIEVRVYRETRTGRRGPYRAKGEDQNIANRLGLQIRDDLANRKEDLNIIDDFRAF